MEKKATKDKNTKSKNSSDKNSKQEEQKSLIPPSIFDKDNKAHIVIGAKPNAKESAVTDINEEYVGISIAAPPKDGEANKELLDFLSGALKVKKTDLDLDKGSKSKHKVVIVSGLSAKDAYEKLRDAI